MVHASGCASPSLSITQCIVVVCSSVFVLQSCGVLQCHSFVPPSFHQLLPLLAIPSPKGVPHIDGAFLFNLSRLPLIVQPLPTHPPPLPCLVPLPSPLHRSAPHQRRLPVQPIKPPSCDSSASPQPRTPCTPCTLAIPSAKGVPHINDASYSICQAYRSSFSFFPPTHPPSLPCLAPLTSPPQRRAPHQRCVSVQSIKPSTHRSAQRQRCQDFLLRFICLPPPTIPCSPCTPCHPLSKGVPHINDAFLFNLSSLPLISQLNIAGCTPCTPVIICPPLPSPPHRSAPHQRLLPVQPVKPTSYRSAKRRRMHWCQ